MPPVPRLFLSELPPELRNEIYTYLSLPADGKASTFSIPLQSKKYECKHTTVQILPVHYGSNALLTMQKFHFLEAFEYQSWLLRDGVEIKIGVEFRGRINTFVQEHWEKKMETHLRKLAKQHPWLKLVRKYDVKILWDPVDGLLKGRKGKKSAGRFAGDMVKTLTGLMCELKRRIGDVKAALHLEHSVAMEHVLFGARFGFADFLAWEEVELGRFKSWSWEVWKKRGREARKTLQSSPLVELPLAKRNSTSSLTRGKTWILGGSVDESVLLMSKTALAGEVSQLMFGHTLEQNFSGTDHISLRLLEECPHSS